MMMWALVPLIPNEDTAARRGRWWGGQGVLWVSRDTAPADQSMWGEGSSICKLAGRIPARIAITILITPATPAAAWVWPIFDLIDPNHNGASPPRSCP